MAPEATAAAVGWIESSPAYDADEEMTISQAVEHRLNEFRTGRRLAREALARLGCSVRCITPDADRVPRWPGGFVGTISHTTDLCAVVVGRTHNLLGIGVDIENINENVTELEEYICRPEESSSNSPLGKAGNSTLLRFVAKEAFYKAYFPATRRFVEFLDLRVHLDLSRNQFEIEIFNPQLPSLGGSRTFQGNIDIVAKHAIAGIWLRRE